MSYFAVKEIVVVVVGIAIDLPHCTPCVKAACRVRLIVAAVEFVVYGKVIFTVNR
jgi:hypothetical protein